MSGRRGRSKSPGKVIASPISASSTPSVSGTTANPMQDFLDMLSKAKIKEDEDYKSIKIPPFSDGTEWESVVFELEVNLEKIWKYNDEMDIVEYLQGVPQYCDPKYIEKADKIIYYALVTAAKRESFARKKIMASRHADAVPQVERNQGLKLFNLFQSTFLNKSKNQANLPNALLNFNQMKMNKGEKAKEYISRVDQAVSELALLNEKVSVNSWIFILANGLLPEFTVTRKGVLFMETGYGSIIEVKEKILQEETVNAIGKPDKQKAQNDSKDSDIAHVAFEGNCNHCGKKGHKKAECNKLKKELKAVAGINNNQQTSKHWCDICYKEGHSTDWCFYNPNNNAKGKGKKGKSKGGKGKGRGKGKGGKGKPGKGGRGKGNFPANYVSEDAYFTDDSSSTTEENWNLKQEEISPSNWYDFSLSIFETEDLSLSVFETENLQENEIEITENFHVPDLDDPEYIDFIIFAIVQNFECKKEYLKNPTPQLLSDIEKYSSFIVNAEDCILDINIQRSIQQFKFTLGYDSIFQTHEPEFTLVLMEADVSAWTQNNAWTKQDFEFCTQGDQPTFAAAKGGPECGFLLNAVELNQVQIKKQLDQKLQQLEERKAKGEEGLWMYLDSGASRSVIQEKSPIRQHLVNVSETNGSCNVGNGANLTYLQKGLITKNNEVTVVKDLKYDLYAAVAAAKRGVSCVLDFSSNGQNQSYLLCKQTGTVTPLIERKQGILEVPIHLYVNGESGLKLTDNGFQEKLDSAKLSSAAVAKFWFGMDQCLFDPTIRTNNTDDISLFMHDIINSLGQRQKDFLIHARLAHLPRKAILQLVKNGAKGLPYDGKFKELCRPCLESRQRAENHGKEFIRHPDGKTGEHLHSDLAIVNIKDYNGFKYVLTVVDEISDEVVITLLKSKTAKEVLAACKIVHKIITARSKSQLKTWQFDRGSEFLNCLFEEWITMELGALQLFSNVEHPWENGRAERSFATLFQKARAMLKHADLPNVIWGKAIKHAVYLKNRSPSTRINLLSPLQFRTGKVQNFTRLRVFGCPAQIFVREKNRANNKLSNRSEMGIFIGMSPIGNGYLFRIQRENRVVEIDSKDVKFNETFSDCMDRKGRKIKGGKVLDPDLFNEPETAYEMMNALDKWKETSRFATPNRFSLDREDNSDDNDPDNSDDNDQDNSDEDKDDPENKDVKLSFNEIKKTLKEKSSSKRKIKPIKSIKKSSNELNRLLPSKGFVSQVEKPSANQSKTRKRSQVEKPPANQSKKRESSNSRAEKESSSRRAENGNNTRKSTRVVKPRDKLQPNFEPTYSRNKANITLDDNWEDLSNLNSTDQTFDDLLSCMEQNIGNELGKLNDPVEDLLKSTQDIGNPDPKSQKAIDKLPEKARKRYNDATTKEYEGMKAKKVMEFVRMSDIPKATKIYICIVNWTTKYVLGVYQKTKCRICFGGHHYVKTFTDCFAPTVNFCSVLIMLSLAAMFGWHLGSLDYSQAYLNANIDEDCFLRAPEFLREYDTDGVEFIWRLKKVIYGHPKGSRLWAQCLDNKLKDLGFSQLATDQCVYAKWVKWNLKDLKADSYFVFVLIHSDDLIVISNLQNKMLQEKEKLLKAFEGVDQGTLSSFCGVEVSITDSKISLSMNYYWKKVMQRFGISDNDTADRPLKTKIDKLDCPETIDEKRKLTYLQIIGSIIFGFTHCRLDLAFPVGMLTRVMHAPSESHMKQLLDLLKYINNTRDWGLNFFRDHTVTYGMIFIFLGFCDSSHADELSSSRSTGGYFFFLRRGQGCICSKSGQSPDVALSSTEAETIWACSAATQGAFIKQFLDELKIFGETSFELMEDSQPAINAQKKNVSQSRFRHIKIKWHYIRQLLSEGWCKMVKINTKDQIADIATKILAVDTIRYFSKVVLGSIDQSLYAQDTGIPFNDWGVVSEPSYLSS